MENLFFKTYFCGKRTYVLGAKQHWLIFKGTLRIFTLLLNKSLIIECLTMKKFLFPVFIIFSFSAFSQSSKQVKWTYTSKKINDKIYEVHFTASINNNWHLYSQSAGDGPLSTEFTFTKNPLIALNGKTKESGKIKKVWEEAFKSEVRYYENAVDFVQTVNLKANAKTNLAGKVEFMVCNDHECLPPSQVDFSVKVGG
jgi:hypothetical protein